MDPMAPKCKHTETPMPPDPILMTDIWQCTYQASMRMDERWYPAQSHRYTEGMHFTHRENN